MYTKQCSTCCYTNVTLMQKDVIIEKKSLMAQWLNVGLRNVKCAVDDLEVMSLNPSRIKLEMHSTSVILEPKTSFAS